MTVVKGQMRSEKTRPDTLDWYAVAVGLGRSHDAKPFTILVATTFACIPVQIRRRCAAPHTPCTSTPPVPPAKPCELPAIVLTVKA
eukprot:SAG31_NODE_412_length_15972_cov_3.590626_2_plen_86_part_00